MNDKDRYRFIHDLFIFNDLINTDHLGYYYDRLSAQSADVRRQQIERKRKLLVDIHAFCLMPNHYHLLLSSRVEQGISLFMKKLNGGYAKYFNEKYKRSGALFQGKYKSVEVRGDPYFSYLPYYIHFNPLDLKMPLWRKREMKSPQDALKYLESYRWSSHLDYLGIKNFPSITRRDVLLNLFGGKSRYAQSLDQTLRGFSLENVADTTLE